MNEDIKFKCCPDLTSHEEVKAIMYGQGDFTRPILHACLKEKCVAFGEPYWCFKYKQSVIYNEVNEDE